MTKLKEYIKHYDDGILKHRSTYLNGRIHGHYISFSPSGTIMVLRNYMYGNPVGYNYSIHRVSISPHKFYLV